MPAYTFDEASHPSWSGATWEARALEEFMDGVVLKARDGSLEVEVLCYGMTIHAIRVLNQGQMYDILAGPDDPGAHANQRRFCGSLVGRYANRLPAGALSNREFTVFAQEWGKF